MTRVRDHYGAFRISSQKAVPLGAKPSKSEAKESPNWKPSRWRGGPGRGRTSNVKGLTSPLTFEVGRRRECCRNGLMPLSDWQAAG
jgi:hypothetical protein